MSCPFFSSYSYRMVPFIVVGLLSLLSGINAQVSSPTSYTSRATTGMHHAGMYASGVPAPGHPMTGMGSESGMSMSYMSPGSAPSMSMGYMSPGVPMSTAGFPSGTPIHSGTPAAGTIPGVSMYGTSMGTGTSTSGGVMSTMHGTEPTMYGTGSTMHGTEPTMYGTGSSMHGTGSTMYGTGSTMHGTEPAMYSTGSSMHSTGSAMHGTGSALHGTGSVMHGTGSTHGRLAYPAGSVSSMGATVIPRPTGMPGFSGGGPAYRTPGMTGVASSGVTMGRRPMMSPPRTMMIGGMLGFPSRPLHIPMGGAGAGQQYADGVGPGGSGGMGPHMFGGGPGMFGGRRMMPGMSGMPGMFGFPRRSFGTIYTGPFGMRGVTGMAGSYGYRGIRPPGMMF